MSRRNSERWMVAAGIGIILTFLAVVMVIAQSLQNVGCWMDWKDSGRQWRFQYGAAICQVHDGKGWVPASRVRVD